MSDQVEIVAAEDAPNDTERGETPSSTQSSSEKPETTTVESVSQTAPVAEKVVTEEKPFVDGPVGDGIGVSAAEEEAKGEPAESPVSVNVSVESAATELPSAENDSIETDSVDIGSDEDVADENTSMENASYVATLTEEPSTDANVADESSTGDESESDEAKSNVRILAVGQQVIGNVKRIADFGAFVDIGVGRDGLIHISELSVRRVGKVTDVLTEGQEVTAWIKKLDRDRNRISLTLIDPNTKTIRDLNKDDLVQGTVTRILPYGAFVDIGIGRDALLHVREMGVGYVAKPEDVVSVGDNIEARIIELSRRRGRVDLSLKGLRDEPEPTPAPQYEQPQGQPPASNSRRQPEPEPEVEEDFEDLEVLSPMELAFKRAMEAEGMELNLSRKKQNKRNRREGNRSLQDEIISRTLSTGRK